MFYLYETDSPEPRDPRPFTLEEVWEERIVGDQLRVCHGRMCRRWAGMLMPVKQWCVEVSSGVWRCRQCLAWMR
jgi:hypothetical protein